MLMFINVIISIVALPILLIFGKPKKVRFAKHYLSPRLNKRFRICKWTPVLELESRDWFARIQENSHIAANAVLCFMIYRKEFKDNSKTLMHETIHIIQQSYFTPILVGLVYAIDVFIFLPFQQWYPENYIMKISVIERLAYDLAEEKDNG